MLFAFLAFSSDVLDDFRDRVGHAVANQTFHTTDHHKGACPNSGCPNHDEAAVLEAVAAAVMPTVQVFSFPVENDGAPIGLPKSIVRNDQKSG